MADADRGLKPRRVMRTPEGLLTLSAQRLILGESPLCAQGVILWESRLCLVTVVRGRAVPITIVCVENYCACELCALS
jgi:hypothetical protein